MIGISKLYCGTVESSDLLRYGHHSKDVPSHLLQFAKEKKPVVVWNVGRRCNLHCVHCYSHSKDQEFAGELTTEEGKALLKDLGTFGSPVILFSGGEPLMREDLPELIAYAREQGMRGVISTNGTLITPKIAENLKEMNLSYVGISIDGLEETHDKFRGVPGSFKKAMEGIKNCQAAGIKVGLRFTINKRNVDDVPGIFDLIEEMNIPRVCFYHLVYSGRGTKIMEEDLNHQETRKVVDLIMDRTADFFARGIEKEVLTVDNHADGVYLYLRMVKEKNPKAADVMKLLLRNGGNSTGHGIGCVSWDGEVHADQFWRHLSFGNVKQRPFSEIWTDTSHPVMGKLKDKKPHVGGRCGKCQYLSICGGNFRVRAEAVTGDLWAADPACYLTDEEIGILKE